MPIFPTAGDDKGDGSSLGGVTVPVTLDFLVGEGNESFS